MVAGLLGALITLWMTFAPCFLWIFAGAPYVERLARVLRLQGALAAVTAAVVGVITNLALWFGLRVLFGALTAWRAGPATLDLPRAESFNPWAMGIASWPGVPLFRLRAGVLGTLAVATLAGLASHLARFA